MVQPTEQAKAELINFLEVEPEKEEGNMVTRRATTIDRFIPDACLAA